MSSGTSSKTVANEKDMLKVGYGAMVLESLLAVLALGVAGAAAGADGTPAAWTPFQIFSSGVAGFFQMFGVPMYIAQCFMTMCVSALALTSLDAVARIGRMSLQELFSVDDMEPVSYTHLDVYQRQPVSRNRRERPQPPRRFPIFSSV